MNSHALLDRDPSPPLSVLRLRHLVAGALLASAASVGCDTSVQATNPYDPDTDPSRQAPSSLEGRLVLRDETASWEALAAEVAYARVGLLDAKGKTVQTADGSPLHARLELIEAAEEGEEQKGEAVATFELVGLEPSTYRLKVEGVGARYVPPTMPEVELRPGVRSLIGDLVFVSFPRDGAGPGSIEGQVRLDDRSGDARVIELYRMEGGGPRMVLQQRSNAEGDFSFDGLPIGRYALRAGLDGFTPDYRMDVVIGETEGAELSHHFTGEQAMLLHPVTAVLIPSVQSTENVYYTREDNLPLAVLPFGGVTAMRLSTRADFLDEDDEQIPFVAHTASAVVPLPDRQGRIDIFAQFESRSASGFVFLSPIFQTSVVRDTTKPVVVDARPRGVGANADGSYYVTPGVTIDIDLMDEHSAVSGIALVQPEDNVPPDVDDLVFDDVTSVGGLVRVSRLAPLPDEDGEWRLYVHARDRATNVSEPFELALKIDRQAPELPLLVSNAAGGQLSSRTALLEFDETGEDDLPITMQVGIAPLRSSSPVLPYESELPFEVTAHPHGSVVAFEARLTDAAGNRALVRSANVVMSLTGTISGRVEVERVPSHRPNHGGVMVTLHEPGAGEADPAVAEALSAEDGGFVFAEVPEAGAYILRTALAGYAPVEQLVPGVAANQSLQLSRIPVTLARGELHGRFGREGLVDESDAHGGIIVLVSLSSPSRNHSLTVTTSPSGEWWAQVPVTLDGETWRVEGMLHGHANALAGHHGVSANEVTVVQPLAADPTAPEMIMLLPMDGDFVLCAPGDDCTPLTYTNLDDLRVQLANTSVSKVRVRARQPFDPDSDDPPFVDFSPDDVLMVNVAGPEGRVSVYVQTKVGTERGPVLSSSFVRDTTPPEIEALVLDPGPDSLNGDFTNRSRVRATVETVPEGRGHDVAPLAHTKLLFSDLAPSAPPESGYTPCGHDVSCGIDLPVSGAHPEEGPHNLYAFACDMAGNCSDPALRPVVYDMRAPSPSQGASIAAADEGTVMSGGVTYTRSPSYYVDINLGSAVTSLDAAVVDLDDKEVPAVAGYRLGVVAGSHAPSRPAEALSGTVLHVLEGEPSPGTVRRVMGPPLPPEDGLYTVYAQLVDAAGNRLPVDHTPFSFELTLDRVPPAVAFSLNSGASVTNDETVTLTVQYDPVDPPVEVHLTTDGGLFEVPIIRDFSSWDDQFHLPAGPDGVYTIHARFFDAAGNFTERQASIRLDRTPPEPPRATCSQCNLVGGTYYTSTANPVLSVFAYDSGGPVSAIRYTHSTGVSEVPYGPTITLDLGGQGNHQTELWAIDEAGNVSEGTTLSFTVDSAAPSLQVLLNGGDDYTNDHEVRVDIVASDDAAWMAFSTSGSINCDVAFYEAYSSFKRILLPDGEGDRSVHVCVKDHAGNTSSAEAGITVDQTPPQVTMTVAGGSAAINTVVTSFQATASKQVVFAAAVGAVDCSRASYSDSYVDSPFGDDITLNPQNGPQVVMLCVRDRAGNIASASDSVVLDTNPPTGTLLIDGGAQYAISTEVNLQISASPDAIEMRVSNDPGVHCETVTYLAVETEVTWPLQAGDDGSRTVTVCLRDEAENVTPVSSSIILVQTPPDVSNADVTIWGEAWDLPDSEKSRIANVEVKIANLSPEYVEGEPIEIADMRVWNGGRTEPTTWQGFETEFEWLLSSGDGPKTVNVRVRDVAGNVSGIAEGTISLHQTPPGAPDLQIMSDDGFPIDSDRVELRWNVPPGTTQVRLERRILGQIGGFEEILTRNEMGDTAYVDTSDVKPGYVHEYRIRGFDVVGNASDWSMVATARPIEPLTQADWVRDEEGGYTFSMRVPRGTFSLSGTYEYDDLQGTVHAESLMSNQIVFERPADPERFNDRLVLRTANLDNSLAFESVLPLDIQVHESLLATGHSSGEPVIVIDQDDHRHIAYVRRDASASTLHVEYMTNAGASWESVEVVELPFEPNTSSVLLSMVLDDSGVAHIAYLHDTGDRALRYTTNASGGWSVPVTIADYVFASSSPPSMALDGFGHIHILYRVSGSLVHATNASGSWQTDRLDIDLGGYSLTIDEAGHAHASACGWADGVLRGLHITNEGGSWTQAILLEKSCLWSSIHTDSMGRVHIGFATRYYIDYAKREMSGQWEVENVKSFSNASENRAMHVEPNGSVHIVYRDRDTSPMSVMYSTNAPDLVSDPGSWRTTIVAQRNLPVDWPSIAVDSKGRAQFAWRGWPDGVGQPPLMYVTNSNLVNIATDVQRTPRAGEFSSLALDSNDSAHISYRCMDEGLRYATNASGAWALSGLTGSSAFKTAIGLDPDDGVHISYTEPNDEWQKELVYVDDLAGPSALVDTVDVLSTSLAAETHDQVHIAYGYSSPPYLKYATNAGGGWSTETLDVGGGHFVSLALGAGNEVHIAHEDNGTLRHVSNESGAWISSTIAGGSLDMQPALTTDHDGGLHLAYVDKQAGRLWYGKRVQDTWVFEVVEEGMTSSAHTPAIAVDGDGGVHIAFTRVGLRYAMNTSGTWTVTLLDSWVTHTSAAMHPSIALDSRGRAHVSYTAFTAIWSDRLRLRYASGFQGVRQATSHQRLTPW